MVETLTSQIIFFLLALMTVGSAVLVVSLKNIMRAAFALLFSLAGVAGLYAMMSADFLAAAQVLIYVGGILVLILFGVMLTQRIYGVDIFAPAGQVIPGAAVSLSVAASLLIAIWRMDPTTLGLRPSPGPLPPAPTTGTIGTLLLTTYVLPFETASVLLLVALVGAAVLARKEVRTDQANR